LPASSPAARSRLSAAAIDCTAVSIVVWGRCAPSASTASSCDKHMRQLTIVALSSARRQTKRSAFTLSLHRLPRCHHNVQKNSIETPRTGGAATQVSRLGGAQHHCGWSTSSSHNQPPTTSSPPNGQPSGLDARSPSERNVAPPTYQRTQTLNREGSTVLSSSIAVQYPRYRGRKVFLGSGRVRAALRCWRRVTSLNRNYCAGPLTADWHNTGSRSAR
jgi:hypothetical protein